MNYEEFKNKFDQDEPKLREIRLQEEKLRRYKIILSII